MRRVLETHQTTRIDGLSVDELTARVVVRVHDGLDEKRRGKFVKLTAKQMVHKAFGMDK